MKTQTNLSPESKKHLANIEDVIGTIVTRFTSNRLTSEYHKYFRTMYQFFLSLSHEEKVNFMPLFASGHVSFLELTDNVLPQTFGSYLKDGFALEKFTPIQNDAYKPIGGLWSCPMEETDDQTQWYSLCESDLGMKFVKDREFYKFMLKNTSNIFVLHSDLDFEFLLTTYGRHIRNSEEDPLYLNYEAIAADFDAILVTDGFVHQMRYWDLETLLVLNPFAFDNPWQ